MRLPRRTGTGRVSSFFCYLSTEAFEFAGLPYFHPHSLRKTLARLGEEVCESPEEFKAWSQNLGHEKVLTTFLNHGSVTYDRQGEIIRGMGSSRQSIQPSAEEIAEAVAQRLLLGEGTSVQSTAVRPVTAMGGMPSMTSDFRQQRLAYPLDQRSIFSGFSILALLSARSSQSMVKVVSK
jgi:hypothetical protein